MSAPHNQTNPAQQRAGFGPASQTVTAPLWPTESGTLAESLLTPAPEPDDGDRKPFWRHWSIKVIGLACVAIVAGGIWLLIEDDAPTKPTGNTAGASTTPSPKPGYRFVPSEELPQPVRHPECAAHAYGKTQRFLTETPCQQLTRGLFTTTTPDGHTVYTSVAVVKMASESDAAQLNDLVTTDNTGNISDLLRDGTAKVTGLSALSQGGFASSVRDSEVVIVESDMATGQTRDKEHSTLMKQISSQALTLADGLR